MRSKDKELIEEGSYDFVVVLTCLFDHELDRFSSAQSSQSFEGDPTPLSTNQSVLERSNVLQPLSVVLYQRMFEKKFIEDSLFSFSTYQDLINTSREFS